MSDTSFIVTLCSIAGIVTWATLKIWFWASKPEESTGGIFTPIVTDGIPFIPSTRENKQMMMHWQNHRCGNPYCNTDLRHNVPHWDHIIPRARGGTDSLANMQWLCATCNMNKGDRDWYQFVFIYLYQLGLDHTYLKPLEVWAQARYGMVGWIPPTPDLKGASEQPHEPSTGSSSALR
jgi:hypothetical protein